MKTPDDFLANVKDALDILEEAFSAGPDQELLELVSPRLTVLAGAANDSLKALQHEAYMKKSQKNRETYAERKAWRETVLVEWCQRNLKSGMIVAVRARNSKARMIISMGQTSLKGHHQISRRHRNEHGRWLGEWQDDDYITDHYLANVTGIFQEFNALGRPIFTPIREYMEQNP